MVCKLVLPTEMQKLHFCVRPWLLLTIFKLFRRGADRHNSILMSLHLLVAETMSYFPDTHINKVKIYLKLNWICLIMEQNLI